MTNAGRGTWLRWCRAAQSPGLVHETAMRQGGHGGEADGVLSGGRVSRVRGDVIELDSGCAKSGRVGFSGGIYDEDWGGQLTAGTSETA